MVYIFCFVTTVSEKREQKLKNQHPRGFSWKIPEVLAVTRARVCMCKVALLKSQRAGRRRG